MNVIKTAWIVYTYNEEAITDLKEMLSITRFCIFILHKIFQCDRILLGPVCSLIAQECVVQKNFCID